jgi:thiamine-phosphate pyrophosphorylase
MARRPATAVRLPMAGLYALTPEIADTGLLVAQVAAAIAGGTAAVQYRNKGGPAALRREQALALRELCASRGVIFIVNDDVELARDIAADGVHLGRDDVAIATSRLRLGANAIIGASCYDSLEQAEQAVASGADYIAFGSFFASRIKPNAARAPLSLLAAARARWRVPVVAIGGITVANAPALIAAGADALAVITALFDTPDVRVAAKAFRDAFASRHGETHARRPARSERHRA